MNDTEIVWLRAHVAHLLEREWDLCRVEEDCDGDVPFQSGTAACWVSVVSADSQPYVRVWANAVHGLERSKKLMSELNDINAMSRTTHVYWTDGSVLVDQVLHAHGVNQVTLAQACEAVAEVANHIGHLLSSVFGGETPLPLVSAGHTHGESG